MGWGDRFDLVLEADYRRVADFVNEYIKSHSCDETLKRAGLEKLLNDNGIKTNSPIFQFSDMCYNSANDGITEKFKDSIHIFDRVDYYHYKILGEGYPFTGEIKHYSGRSHEYVIDGEWLNGKIIVWNPKDKEKENEYYEQAIKEFEIIDDQTKDIVGDERLVVTKQRINQSIFKKRLLKRYECKCCLCGVSGKDMLIASHIKPWRDADMDERVDVNNGLLFCPNHDWVFDKGYISFAEDGSVMISEMLDEVNRVFMNLDDRQLLNMSDETRKYMEHHRMNCYKG